MEQKGQSRKASFTEALLNITIGFFVAVTAQMMIFPVFGIEIPTSDHYLLGLFFTGVSLVRSYCLRRFFNWLHIREED